MTESQQPRLASQALCLPIPPPQCRLHASTAAISDELMHANGIEGSGWVSKEPDLPGAPKLETTVKRCASAAADEAQCQTTLASLLHATSLSV